MSKTSLLLGRDSSLWSALFSLASRKRRTAYRRTVITVATSDSVGGLCPHPTQPHLEDCGWGLFLTTLTLRQRGNEWEVVRGEDGEEVLAVLRDWEDLENLSEELDERLAAEIIHFRGH